MSKNKLEQYILATLNYFDIFEYPLTLFEVRKNLINLDNISSHFPSTPRNPPYQWGCGVDEGEKEFNFQDFSLAEIENALSGERLKNVVGKKNGFYFLKQNNSNYWTRQKRYYFADKKFKRAKKIAWMLCKIPFIKMIAICNSLSYSNVREDSDIDFFIVTAKNRVWTVRFLAVILIKFLNLRPKKERVKDTICISFFVDEDNLNLEKFKIAENDIYLIFWTTQLFPIYDKDNTYEKFFRENGWVEKILSDRIKCEVEFSRNIFASNRVGTKCELNKNSVQTNWPEKFFKKIQLKFMNERLKKLANKDTRVVVNDGVLKLFAIDRREEYMNRWLKAIESGLP